MGNANLKQWLIEPLNNQFWREFLETLEEEYDIIRESLIFQLENFFNYRDLTSNDNLLDIPPHFGYVPDLSIDSTIEYIRREIESIGFRKKVKTTYLGYEYIYKAIEYNGQIFSLYYDSVKLIRTESEDNITNIVALSMYDKPYLWLAEKDFSEFFDSQLEYDDLVLSFTYDEPGLSYDSLFQKIATRHVAPEYFIDRILTVDSNEYLMTVQYLDYLANGVEYNRRASEVPHNGCQIGSFMDLSGFYDNLSGDTTASIPDIKLKASIIPFFFNYATFNPTLIKIGTGVQSLVSSTLGGLYPTDLASPIFEEELVVNEIFSGSDLAYLQTIVEIKYIEDEIITSSPTSSISYTLNKKYIRRLDFKLIYEIGSVSYEAYDDGEGNIIGDFISSGIINYSTGEINITFSSPTTGSTSCNYIYNSNYRTKDSNYSNIEITEAGIFNELGEMIAYMTFPPIEYNPNNYHIGFQFIILNQSTPVAAIPQEAGFALYNDTVYST